MGQQIEIFLIKQELELLSLFYNAAFLSSIGHPEFNLVQDLVFP
jgi:hypothetical protein